VALLRPGFLFQGLEQSAAVAMAAEIGLDPEIMNLHALPPDRADDPTHQLTVGVVEPDSNVLARIDGRGGDVVGNEFVA